MSETKKIIKAANGHIEVIGAREHNLKGIDVRIPRNQLVVITGISRSSKSLVVTGISGSGGGLLRVVNVTIAVAAGEGIDR